MSNIENKLLAGFYAFPPSQGEILKKLITFKGNSKILDPTCGEGAVLQQLTSGHEDKYITTFGVELDKGRAAAAKEVLDNVVQAPIESMVISNNEFPAIFLNPPYDREIKGMEDEKSERKEYIELERGTRYLAPEGVMIYTIPSYRFSYPKIAKHLASHYENVAVLRFTKEEYENYKQCVFIGVKKQKADGYILDKKLYEFLLQMESEDFIQSKVTPMDRLIGFHSWSISESSPDVPIFYSKIDGKEDYLDFIASNRGFKVFMERTKPKKLEIGGDPAINISTGQMALLLASGAINGVIGENDTLHAVQGVETEGKIHSEEMTKTGTIYKTKTSRTVTVKCVLPSGTIKKFA